jgi:hypothetical protein
VRAYKVFGQLLGETSTDAQGRWKLLLVPGTYRLLAFDPSLAFATGFYGDATSFAATQSLIAAEGTSLTAALSLPRAGRIVGSVYAAATNIPLGGMTVLAYDAAGNLASSVTTDASGIYRLALPAGTYRLAAADPAHRYATLFHSNAVSFDSATAITLASSQEISGIRFTLARSVVPLRRRAAR